MIHNPKGTWFHSLNKTRGFYLESLLDEEPTKYSTTIRSLLSINYNNDNISFNRFISYVIPCKHTDMS
jgi:hypothetical protein